MQQNEQAIERGHAFEREAARRLPGLLEELFHEQGVEVHPEQGAADRGVEFTAEAGGRLLLIEVKATSRPNVVVSAADQLRIHAKPGDVLVLVVPYMTRAGAQAAAERDLNWIDLSGNAHLRHKDLYVHVTGQPNR